MNRFRAASAATLGLILLAVGPLRAADLRMRAAAAWAENIGRSSSPLDWTDTMQFDVSATAAQARQLSGSWLAVAAADVSGSIVPRYEKRNRAQAGARGMLQYKWGLGPMAPLFQASGTTSATAGGVSAANGLLLAGELIAAKRLNESWSVRLGADWQRTYARNESYDTLGRRLFGEVSWDFTPEWRLTYGYGRQWSDLTATASALVWGRALSGALGPAVRDYYVTVPRVVTDEFAPGWVSYRVHGETEIWWLEASPALTDRTSLALRFDSLFTVNRAEVKYRQTVWTLGLRHTF